MSIDDIYINGGYIYGRMKHHMWIYIHTHKSADTGTPSFIWKLEQRQHRISDQPVLNKKSPYPNINTPTVAEQMLHKEVKFTPSQKMQY